MAFASVAAAMLFLPANANAAVLVDVDASVDDPSAFGRIGNGNCQEGSVSEVNDPERGRVFRFSKPASGNRCEHRGYRGFEFEENSTFHIGWWFKLSDTSNNNAIFQWKSFNDHEQNFPVVLKMVDDHLTLLHSPLKGDDRDVWRSTEEVQANTWNHVVLTIHTNSDRDERGGFVELTFNDEKAEFPGGSTRFIGRTWDAQNDAKMGVYGGRSRDISNFIDGVRVARSFAEAAST